MDITPQDNTIQPISDDQELAKALAGVLPDEPESAPASNNMQFEETTVVPPQVPAAPVADLTTPTELTIPAFPEISSPEAESTPASSDASLDSIKAQALNELRPLIDRVDLPAEERFDAYLMLLRSTDDSTLVAPAHSAAQDISDEKRKAEALLEIIKEIDYLSRKTTQSNA